MVLASEKCDGCSRMMPNVGPWKGKDGVRQRLCGGCKLRTCLARPGFLSGIASDISKASGLNVTIEAKDEDGLPIVHKGDA